MGHSKKSRRGRVRGGAGGAAEEALFERALLGEEAAGGRSFDPRRDRKTLQLCRQVQRALGLALAGECGDAVLRDAYVEGVEALGGAGQLLVRVVVPGEAGTNAAEVMARLAAATPRLRAIVAAEICRKRVPMLSFVVVPQVGQSEISDSRFEISDGGNPHPGPLPEYREREKKGPTADHDERRSLKGGGDEH